MIFRNIAAFARNASGYLKEAKNAEPGHTQAIRARYARKFLDELGISYEGPTKEQIESNGPCIYVCNHTSNLDAVLICAFFEGDLRILAKESLFKIPWLGRILRLERHILVHRGKNASARNASIRDDIKSAIADKASVLFFPEGTRTSDGSLGAFKSGAFYNAIQTGVNIVPMVVHGAFEAMPKKSLSIKPGHCSLQMLSPISLPDASCGSENERVEILKKQAFEAIQQHLGDA